MLRSMIIGAGFHYDDTTVANPDGSTEKVSKLKELTAEEHPHPLIAAVDSPECCKAAADYQITGDGDASAAVAEAAVHQGAGGKLYIAPGNFARPEPEPAPGG